MQGSFPDEVGLKVTSFSGKGKRDSGRLFVLQFTLSGKASYDIDFSKQTIEFGSVTPFSHEGGTWSIENNRLHLMTPTRAAAYTGGYRVANQKVGSNGHSSCRGFSHAIGKGKGRTTGVLGRHRR